MYVIFKKVCRYILVLFSFKKLKRIEPNKDNIILKYIDILCLKLKKFSRHIRVMYLPQSWIKKLKKQSRQKKNLWIAGIIIIHFHVIFLHFFQQIAFKNLVERNKEREKREGPPAPNSAIQLPFIIVNTSKKTVIDCSISNDKMEYLFNFDDTFEIHDDMEVKQQLWFKFENIFSRVYLH